jgi:hypothetical protein
MFGLYPRFKPKMAKVYGNTGEVILTGLKQYVAEVAARRFPQPENWFGIKDEQLAELRQLLAGEAHEQTGPGRGQPS